MSQSPAGPTLRRTRRQRSIHAVAVIVAVLATACGGSDDDRGSSAFFGPGVTLAPEAQVAVDTSTSGASSPVGDGTTPAGPPSPAVQERPTAPPDATPEARPDLPNGGATYTGVTGDTIKLVYFWTASQTENNPFLDAIPGANANEAQAVRAWVDWVNQRAAGGSSIMGFPFDLHGRTLEVVVVDAGEYTQPEANRAAAQKIVTEIRPFITFSNAGATSTRMCPILAEAKMLQTSVANLDFDLHGRTDGFCLPVYQTLERQAAAARGYLVNRMNTTPYAGPESAGQPVARSYGFVYSEFPGATNSAPVVLRQLRDAGLPIAAAVSMSGDLAAQQQQAPNVAAQLRAAGVNTVIPFDAIVPLTVGAAADAQGYRPDWFIWPCSGADFTALARLYSQNQWNGARGPSCTDPHFSPDLVQDDESRDSEWFREYQTVDASSEPPAQAPLIYAHLHTILVGITNAGPNLNPDTFLEGLERATAKRYSFRSGVTENPSNMLITVNEPRDHSMIGDFAEVRWSVTKRRDGSRFSGAYEFLDGGRRRLAHEF